MAELSVGQLVIGMSILLMICLASFLMGVVVGKFDPSLNPDIALESVPALDSAPPSMPRTVAAVEHHHLFTTGADFHGHHDINRTGTVHLSQLDFAG